jgi:hypothetical protein
VRIPVGHGFAGRIAAEHRPVILDRVDHTTVLNPILWAKGSSRWWAFRWWRAAG